LTSARNARTAAACRRFSIAIAVRSAALGSARGIRSTIQGVGAVVSPARKLIVPRSIPASSPPRCAKEIENAGDRAS
jgi:hypothetical protein